MITLQITKQAKQQEWSIILTIAKNSGFPLHIIRKLKNKIKFKTKNKSQPHTNATKETMGHLHILQSTHSQGRQLV
jgi:hypothetical protein